MYQPPHFREEDLGVQHALIRANPLGLLVTAAGGEPTANLLPFHLDASLSEKGTLQVHMARANGQWRQIEEGAPVLVVFQGADAYVTPSWYATKQETGRVVPTWNYIAVHAYGPVEFFQDPERLLQVVTRLTRRHEQSRPAPWAVGDAPADFIAAQLRGIVGIRIPVTKFEGKRKMSQNRPEADRIGVAAGLAASEKPGDRAVASLIPVPV